MVKNCSCDIGFEFGLPSLLTEPVPLQGKSGRLGAKVARVRLMQGPSNPCKQVDFLNETELYPDLREAYDTTKESDCGARASKDTPSPS